MVAGRTRNSAWARAGEGSPCRNQIQRLFLNRWTKLICFCGSSDHGSSRTARNDDASSRSPPFKLSWDLVHQNLVLPLDGPEATAGRANEKVRLSRCFLTTAVPRESCCHARPQSANPAAVAQPASNIEACLLCGSCELEVADQLSGKEVIALWKASGRSLSAEALLPANENTPVSLYHCKSCGFRFYDPSLMGSARFYEELMAGGYYAGERPEFRFTLRFARRNAARQVLDVGCGDGAFLDLAKAAGLQTYGVELNAAGAERAARKGHQIVSKPLEKIVAGDIGGGVDLITAFQVVEHVPAPLEFVSAAVNLVRQGGWIVISVPNEFRGFGLCPYDPGNWPPHHITRWRFQDFERLADRLGLKIVGHGSDHLDGATLQDFIIAHNRLAPAIGRKSYPVSDSAARTLTWFYRKLGCKYFVPRLGRSIYVILQRQGPPEKMS